MAEVDSVRVFRGIYGGFALAMSEAEGGIHFEELPSSDEIANEAFKLSHEVIADDAREVMPGAQQEFTALTIALAVLEHGGRADGITKESVSDTLKSVWALINNRWAQEAD
jgi:hypothetical protein